MEEKHGDKETSGVTANSGDILTLPDFNEWDFPFVPSLSFDFKEENKKWQPKEKSWH
jgi:hypothetical protein